MTKYQVNRRSLLKASFAVAGGTLLPMPWFPKRRVAFGAPAAEPHFLLLAVPAGGMDPSYLFDARPLAMTKANIKANYLNEEPAPWTGSNGQTTLATSLVAPLKPYQADFTVLNGVHMAASFDGHEQNMNYLLTGNPFGGESFVPHLNDQSPTAPLDYVQSGDLFADLTNDGASIPLSASATQALVTKLNAAPAMTDGDPLLTYMRGRMTAIGAGAGQFSAASKAMATAAGRAPDLNQILRGLTVSTNDLDTALEFFKSGVTPAAVLTLLPLVPNANLTMIDTHAPTDAAKTGTTVGSIAEQLASIFQTLKATPFDGQRSMLDVTTVVMASEFSRTLRHPDLPIDQTGTDHNPTGNSVIIGGKGIKGGMVIGQSDYQTPDEVLSGAHLQMDADKLKVVGRPFDFKAMAPRSDKPAAYDAKDYLLFASVANTIYTAFGADQKHFWQTERNGPNATVLSGLLTT